MTKLSHINSEGVWVWRQSSHFIHFSFSLRLLSLFCFAFPFVFSLFYFCSVCAVVIMGSQPQMSLALPCSALREGHWNAEVTTIQLAQHGGHRPGTPRGCTPRGRAEGDIYPKHCSVDQDKIFILLSHHCTRTAALLWCRSFIPKNKYKIEAKLFYYIYFCYNYNYYY